VTLPLLRTSEVPAAAAPRRQSLFARRSRAVDERRIIEYLETESAVSETSISLARKLGVDLQTTREVLEDLADAGQLRRRTFPDIEWMYCRFPSLDER
jgi:hypothetical protein